VSKKLFEQGNVAYW